MTTQKSHITLIVCSLHTNTSNINHFSEKIINDKVCLRLELQKSYYMTCNMQKSN